MDSNEDLALRAQAGDREARDRLVDRNMALVHDIVGRYRLPYEQRREAVQEGAIGLMEAADSYRPEPYGEPVKFSTHASWRVRKRVSEYYRMHVKRFARESRPADLPFVTNHKHNGPTTATDLRLSSEASREPQVGDYLDTAETRAAVRELVGRLRYKHRRVIILHYGLQDGRQRNLAEVGKEMGISREAARQLLTRSLRWLRKIRLRRAPSLV